MVKPLYIVFIFFALSLCKKECVTLTKKDGDGGFTCEEQAGQGKNTSTNGICNQLVSNGVVNANLHLKQLLDGNINENSPADRKFISLQYKGTSDLNPLELCYEITGQEGQEEEERHEGQEEEEEEERILKNEGNNLLSNVLPTAVEGLNQKPKGSLIMAI